MHFLKVNPKLKNVILVQTKETAMFAERLAGQFFVKYKNITFRHCHLSNPRNAWAIYTDIRQKAKLSPKDSIHLNYTGGTKNMAVHTYRAVYNEFRNPDAENCSFSYLDASAFRIVSDKGNPLSEDLRNEIRVDIHTLMELHGCQKVLKDKKKDKQAGDDFESYVLHELANVSELKSDPWQLHSNWRMIKGGSAKEFEIDIMLIYGYQLCGISVTTSKVEKICKGKGFEILHRARQLGGDEARAILLTPNDETFVTKVESDLLTDTGGDKNLKILGKDALGEKLWPAIQEHISGEEIT